MSIQVDTNRNLSTLIDTILSGKATLFVGSGVSTLSGAPDGKQLLTKLKKDFPSLEQDTSDLIDAFQDLQDDPACGPEKLNDYLRNAFLGLIPSDFHLGLTEFNWHSIFTTNYDKLIEQAYESRGYGAKLRRIVEFDFNVNLRDYNKIFLFKLMGSADVPLSQEGDMVLSRKQFHENLSNRERYLQQIRDSLLDSTLIIVGYSGRDRILFDVIEKTMETRTIDKIPYSFIIVHKDSLSTKDLSRLTSKKIIPIYIDLNELISKLRSAKKSAPISNPKPNVLLHTINVETIKILLNEQEFNSYSEDFEILTDEAIVSSKVDKDTFFKALTKSWAPFREGWDFKREAYPQIQKKVFSELALSDPKDNTVLTISGPPGSGKSTALRRLAYDVYSSGYPVIILNEQASKLDYRLIDAFIVTINHKFDEAIGGEKHRPIKPLIIIDDAPSLLFDPSRISQYLKTRSRAALFVVAGRTGEWSDSWLTGVSANIPKNTFRQDDRMSIQEIASFLKYLKEILDVNLTEQEIIEASESSFFASMYTAIDTTHRPLDEIIKGLYKNLPINSKNPYEIICTLHQFGITFPQLLLARCLDCKTTEQLFEYLSSETRDTIVEDDDVFGNLFYRSQHRIVAKRTIDFFLGDPSLQMDVIKTIISRVNFNIRSERSIIERLLVRDIHTAKFSYQQKRELYKLTTERQPIRSVIHHWGILEMDNKDNNNNNMIEAKRLLELALNTKESLGAFKSESDKNILTSLGVLHSRIAIQNYKKSPETADRELADAEAYFERAKISGFMGEHPYGAHADMLYNLACQKNNETDQYEYLSSALQIIDSAKKRGIAKKDGTFLDEIELKVWAKLKDEEKIKESIEIIADKRNNAKGYYLYAKFLKRNRIDRKSVETAYETLVEGLKRFPDDADCISLRLELFIQLYPKDQKQLYNLLSEYAEQSAYPQISLLFEAATLAIQLGYYSIGLKWYQKLERLSRAEENRFGVRKYLLDSSGNKRILKGQITRIIDQYSGEILCESLIDYPKPIEFRPIGLPLSEGDTVTFNLGFCLVAPFATNIRRI